MNARVLKALSLLILIFAGGWASGESPAGRTKSTWAQEGESLALACAAEAPSTAQSAHGDAQVTLACRAQGPADATLRIRYTHKNGTNAELVVPLADFNGGDWRPQEILWSPDGGAFLINGSENAYAGTDFFVFRVQGNTLVRSSITRAAQSDMRDRLARCWPYIREIAGNEPQFNMSAISWTANSLAVFAEVPCTSNFENSMCSVYGYEVDATSGAVGKVLSDEEVRKDWHSHMSWSMAESGLPTCDPQTGKIDAGKVKLR